MLTGAPERAVAPAAQPHDGGYRVRLDVFEGPLDLLCHLVEEAEIDIWDIPIARITEQYLAYLDSMRRLDIEVAGEYLVWAARLIHIKARMLLPEEPAPEAEDESEEDPRLELAYRLMEYKLFRQAAEELAARGAGREGLFSRPPEVEPRPKATYPDSAGGLTPADLARAFRRILAAHRPSRELPIPRARVSVPEKILSLRRLFLRKKRMRFDAVFSGAASRGEVIATFLALLELVRQGFLSANQEGPFQPIFIRLREDGEANPDD